LSANNDKEEKKYLKSQTRISKRLFGEEPLLVFTDVSNFPEILKKDHPSVGFSGKPSYRCFKRLFIIFRQQNHHVATPFCKEERDCTA
jgi:hypothetical protein